MKKQLVSGMAVFLFLAACGSETEPSSETDDEPATATQSAIDDSAAANLLLAEWDGPYGGVPAFESVSIDGLKTAMMTAMARQRAEILAITENEAEPTFSNTIHAYEASGEALDRIFTYWGIWRSNMSTPEFRAVQREMSPILSAFFTETTQNKALFGRIRAVYESAEMDTLSAHQQRAVQLIYDGFARGGALLEGDAAQRFGDINTRLSELHTTFANNVLYDEENYPTFFTALQAGGLSEGYLKSAAAAAERLGQAGMYAVTNTRSSMAPFLTFAEDRALREEVWTKYYSRGDNGGEHDNNAIISEILKLRDERVGLLGYETYADWRLGDRMAGTPERAMKLMMTVWPAAISRVREEVADMQAIADADGVTIKPWDYRFYAEKVRKAKYDLDSDEVKQYLQLDNLRDAMFDVAGQLFGFAFTPVQEGTVPVFHEDVKVWDVTNKATGQHIGLWYLDPFARPGKRSGAWATSYRSRTNLTGTPTNVLASNNSNFVKGADGDAVLISWSDAETLFHEFGHALHSLSSQVDYPTLNSGVRDYTEFQSQLLEYWLSTDYVINSYLKHVDTGDPMPADLIAKIKRAANFNQGFATTEYLASAIVDLKYHTTDPANIDPDVFERETLAALGMPEELVMRHRSPHFGHIFSGEGYSAGYYGYMWADVLTADSAEAFRAAPGGFYDRELAEKLVTHLFSVRNAVDPKEAYKAFRGRDADVSALLRDRGFAPDADTSR